MHKVKSRKLDIPSLAEGEPVIIKPKTFKCTKAGGIKVGQTILYYT